MAKVAILVDGGYFLKRLPRVRRDVDARDPLSVVGAIEQLVDGHLAQLNELYHVANPRSLLYRCLFYDAIPYRNKGELPISRRADQLRAIGCSQVPQTPILGIGAAPEFRAPAGGGSEAEQQFMGYETGGAEAPTERQPRCIQPHRFAFHG